MNSHHSFNISLFNDTMNKEKIASSEIVCVTGANGFLGSYIVKELLERNYHVRGTVRSTKDEAKTAYLRSLPNAEKLLELVEADLNEENCFVDAFKGCRFVIHSASPFTFKHKNPQRDLVDPAVKGTMSALTAALQNNIERVVLTSSVGAITDEPVKRYTEADWNTTSSLKRNPYYFSKTVAERAAWEFIEEHKDDKNCPEMVAILPGAIVGPPMTNAGFDNPPNNLVYQILDGKLPALLDFGLHFVSIGDVAAAHVNAMEKPEAKGERYIITNRYITMKEIAEHFRPKYPKAKIPSSDMTGKNWTRLMKFFTGFMKDPTFQLIHHGLGKTPEFDTSKSQNELNMKYQDVWQDLDNLVTMMVDVGFVKCLNKKK